MMPEIRHPTIPLPKALLDEVEQLIVKLKFRLKDEPGREFYLCNNTSSPDMVMFINNSICRQYTFYAWMQSTSNDIFVDSDYDKLNQYKMEWLIWLQENVDHGT